MITMTGFDNEYIPFEGSGPLKSAVESRIDFLEQELIDASAALARHGDIIFAVKAYRSATRADLSVAKQWVDSFNPPKTEVVVDFDAPLDRFQELIERVEELEYDNRALLDWSEEVDTQIDDLYDSYGSIRPDISEIFDRLELLETVTKE